MGERLLNGCFGRGLEFEVEEHELDGELCSLLLLLLEKCAVGGIAGVAGEDEAGVGQRLGDGLGEALVLLEGLGEDLRVEIGRVDLASVGLLEPVGLLHGPGPGLIDLGVF